MDKLDPNIHLHIFPNSEESRRKDPRIVSGGSRIEGGITESSGTYLTVQLQFDSSPLVVIVRFLRFFPSTTR